MPFHPLLKLFTLVGIVYAGYALLVFFMQRQIIYPGRTIRVSGQAPIGIVPITVVTTTGRGEAWFMPPLELNFTVGTMIFRRIGANSTGSSPFF